MSAIAVPKTQEQMDLDSSELKIGRGKANFWFGVLTLIYFFDILDRQAVTAVFPGIKAAYNLTDVELGSLSSVISFTTMILAIPVSWLVDKWSRKFMVTIMVIVWSAATWFTGAAADFSQMLFARGAVGAGESAYNPAGYALVTAWYPRKLRGTMIGIFNIVQPLGAFGGVGIAGWIAVNWGWRAVFGLFAIPGFFLAILMLWSPDYKAKKATVEAALGPTTEAKPAQTVQANVSFMETLRYVLKSPTILMVYLAYGAVMLWAMGGFGTWTPTFYGRTFKLDMAQAGAVVMVIGIIAMAGPLLGGLLSDRLVRRSPKGRLQAGIIVVTGALIFWSISLVSAMNGAVLPVVAGFWAAGNLCIAGFWGVPVVVEMELVPPQMRGLTQGISALVSLIPAVVAPMLTGFFSDTMGGLSQALLAMLVISLVLTILGLALSLRTYDRDLAKLKAQGTFTLDNG